MKLSVPESKETRLFKSYISQKFFNACNSLVPQSEVKDFWLDTTLYPFIFFIPDIIETIKREKNFKVVFMDTLNPNLYQFSNQKIMVLVSSDPRSLKNVFSKLEQIIDKATKELKVRLGWIIFKKRRLTFLCWCILKGLTYLNRFWKSLRPDSKGRSQASART
jgi:hypothetical protein